VLTALLSKHKIFEKSEAVAMAAADCDVDPDMLAIVENMVAPACAHAIAGPSRLCGIDCAFCIKLVTL
jgi:hypothetical protein